MIAITCPMAGRHKKKETKTFPVNPFDEERAVCPECKWETTPEWELDRMYRIRESGGGSLEDRESLAEMRNYANWLILQCLKRTSEGQQNLPNLAHEAATYITNKRCPQLKGSIHGWVFTEQFKKALSLYANCDVDSRGLIVKQPSLH